MKASVLAMLMLLVALAPSNVFASTPTAPVDYYAVGTPTGFARSTSAFSLSEDSYSLSQSAVVGGVQLAASTDGTTGEVSSGFYIVFGTLAMISTVDFGVVGYTHTGTMTLRINLVFDKDNDGEFGVWGDDGTLQGLGSDDYAYTSVSGSTLHLDQTTSLYLVGEDATYTLAQFTAGFADGISSATVVAFWICLDSDGSEASTGGATVLLTPSLPATINPVPVQSFTNGTGYAPSVAFSDGQYVYLTSYGKFAFSGTTPLNYSLTPNPIGLTTLYSAFWLNATLPAHSNFPYVGHSVVVTATSTVFTSTTEACADAPCTNIIAIFGMTWHFYSSWVPPKVSILITKTGSWAQGDFHLFWVHSVTDYTKWMVQGQCVNGQINISLPIASITQLQALTVLGTGVTANIVDDHSRPSICTRLDWSDYAVTRPILGGQFTNPIVSGPNLVIDFGVNVLAVDPTVAIVIPPVPTEGGPGAGTFWGQTSTTAHTSISETSPIAATPSSSFTIPSNPTILQQQLETWLRGGSNGVPNILLAFLIGVAFIFIFKKRRN